ncbi:MAG: 3-oxoacyl-ACP reductase FabG [Armatimonadetes bacterium]|nr:3-oxoacyl-ACP reductase FabG [Armatimonadota bacterium]MBM3946719.1 3-oxoacyl-ACP reductase FabG [SAR202 cluster bacterium]
MSLELFSLHGKVAIVTGASKGLGLDMARALAEAGADLAITSRHLAEVSQAAAEIREATGRRVIGIEADAGSARDVDAMVERTVAEFGQLDILVNNAGINRHAYVHEQSEEDWNAVIQIDLNGPMLCTRAATRHMIPRRTGRIINIASILGLVGYPKRGPYCAAKGALVNLTRCYAVELAEHQITVNCVCPGPFVTPLTEGLVQGPVREDFTRRIPLGRWGQPQELVGAILYLASDAASFTTGAVLTVDGGWTSL